MKDKPDPTLLRTLYLPKISKKGHQNLVKLSLKAIEVIVELQFLPPHPAYSP
jgi:hypothetical protein